MQSEEFIYIFFVIIQIMHNNLILNQNKTALRQKTKKKTLNNQNAKQTATQNSLFRKGTLHTPWQKKRSI